MKISSIQLPQARLFAGVAIGVLIGVIGVGAVTAHSPSAASPAQAAPALAGPAGASGAPAAGTATKPAIRLGVLRQAIGRQYRVDVTATGVNGTHNILYVRGALAVGASSVTVTLPDNSTQTFAVDSTTVVREKGQTIAFSALTNGERAMVFGMKNSDGSYTAKLIRCVKEPKAAAPAPSAATN
jgi:Domain of unknown function (DUF5666)